MNTSSASMTSLEDFIDQRHINMQSSEQASGPSANGSSAADKPAATKLKEVMLHDFKQALAAREENLKTANTARILWFNMCWI